MLVKKYYNNKKNYEMTYKNILNHILSRFLNIKKIELNTDYYI